LIENGIKLTSDYRNEAGVTDTRWRCKPRKYYFV